MWTTHRASLLKDNVLLSASEEEQLAEELEVLFTRYVQLNENDIFEVNEANLSLLTSCTMRICRIFNDLLTG